MSSSSQPGAPAHKTLTVSINLGPLGVAQDSSKPARKKRKVVKDPIVEDNPIDDEDKDITYVPDEEPEEPEEEKMFHLLNHLLKVLSLEARHIWNMLHLL